MTHPATMVAMAIDGFGGPEVVTAHDWAVPSAGPGEVLVKVAFAGVGVWDGAMRQGLMEGKAPASASLPRILGADGSGIVADVGDGVDEFSVGDKVYVYSFFNPKGGTNAEYVAVPSSQVARVPQGLTLEQAGALAVTGLTALRGLDDTLGAKAGLRIAVFGASGGVGHPAVQLAKAMGVEVLAVVSSDEGAALVREAGADAVVNSRTDDLASAVGGFAPGGLDGVLATVNAPGLDALTALVRSGGRVAFPHGVQPEPTAPAGVEVLGYDGGPDRPALDKLNALIGAAPFIVHISDAFPLADAPEAHRALAAPHLGRIVLSVG